MDEEDDGDEVEEVEDVDKDNSVDNLEKHQIGLHCLFRLSQSAYQS